MKFKTLDIESLPDVELILTAEEAQVLTAIVGKISGYSETDSPRQFLSDLYNKLYDAGYCPKPHGNSVIWKGMKFQFLHDMRVNKA